LDALVVTIVSSVENQSRYIYIIYLSRKWSFARKKIKITKITRFPLFASPYFSLVREKRLRFFPYTIFQDTRECWEENETLDQKKRKCIFASRQNKQKEIDTVVVIFSFRNYSPSEVVKENKRNSFFFLFY
jgi:hypothetical protein